MDNNERDPKKKSNQRGRPRKRCKKSENTGRVRVSGEEASARTMYRRANELLKHKDYNIAIIELAIKIHHNRMNNKEVNSTETNDGLKHTKDTALAFYLENDYSKSRYTALVKDCQSKNISIYPSYDNIKQAMVECQPENYKSSENEIIIPLQDMLNQTVKRLCDAVALEWEDHHLELIVTLGFDSSSGHTNPHQSYENVQNESFNAQQFLFISSMIIISLRNTSGCSWVNPTPQSVRFCRPLRISVEKENDLAIIREHDRLNNEIESLAIHRFRMANRKLAKVKFNVSQTLFDGKCINTIVGNTASSRCPMCLRTAHQFSNLEDDFAPKQSSLKFGLGLLHDEIKAFEHLIHISYRLILKKWDIRKNVREQFEERKKCIQRNIYDKIGVRVDQILQGHGTTNTGNVARTCFKNPDIFAEALELDIDLVRNIAIILSAFKCKKSLNLDKLKKFCWETYCLHYTLYPWVRMNPTLHKLLIHSCDIAKQFPLPVAYYSEDANESWHKLYRKHMTSHSRQNSRRNRLLDIFNRAVYLTDPKISLILVQQRIEMYKKKNVSQEIQQFIAENQMTEESGSDCESSDDEI